MKEIKELVELHEQVESSLKLLSSLESFVGTFQKDLTAVSGHISDLQARSKDFDARLQGRKHVSKPLSTLLSSITIPPPLAVTLLDTPVTQAWGPVIQQLELQLQSIPSYAQGKGTETTARVKAAKDLEGVAEGLRIVATTKIRTHFLTLLNPIRTDLTTNLPVIQSSVFIGKYLPLYRFLQRNAPAVAEEIRTAYARCVKLYYETGVRRYTRSLGWLRARVNETPTIIGAIPTLSNAALPKIADDRLVHGKLEGPGVILAFMADDKNFTTSLEAIFRSALLVLLDNTTGEFAFIQKFFSTEPFPSVSSIPSSLSDPSTPSTPRSARPPTNERPPLSSVSRNGSFPTLRTNGADDDVTPRPSSSSQAGPSSEPREKTKDQKKEEQKMLENMWKEIFEPIWPYFTTLINSLLTPTPPPLLSLLTMIRLADSVLAESNRRLSPHSTSPNTSLLEPFLLSLRFQLWPLFQKQMSDNVESLKKLADGSPALSSSAFGSMGSLFGGNAKNAMSDDTVKLVVGRYAVLFSSVIWLSEGEEEVMLFSNLQRLRSELNRLINAQASKIKDPAQSASFTSSICENLLQMISSGERLNTHPKAQAEVAFWREREEEARRRIASTRR